MKTIRYIAFCAIIALVSFNQHVYAQLIEHISGEYFWGISSGYGSMMPIGTLESKIYSITDSLQWNLSSPIIVSNKGRFLCSDKPFDVVSDHSAIKHNSSNETVSAGKTLRQTYLYAMSKYFKPDGTKPSDDIFSLTFYNTWMGLEENLSQLAIEDYANGILNATLKPGCIVIDHGWQNHNGSFEFNYHLFQDPKSMVEKLHSKGFKVMLEITPMVSADCLDFLRFKKMDLLEKNPDGTIKFVEWYGGISAILNLSSEQCVSYINERLDYLSSEYKIDGYKFDYVDAKSFRSIDEYQKRINAWTAIASRFPLNQIHEAYKSKNYSSLVGLLKYQDQNWSSISKMTAEAINAGLCGYPIILPDVVGGGFSKTGNLDNALIVRQAQLQAFMPSMHFSTPVWKILPSEIYQMIKSAQSLHEELLPYITQLVSSAVQNGEPIIRSMEYVFPGKGFYDCMDQFMLGNRYLVAPVMSADNTRTVRLPAGTWIDNSGKKVKGPAVIKVNVPLDRILYFKSIKDIKSK